MNKEGSFKPMIIVMVASLAIASLWNTLPMIKDSIHVVLDPSAGALLNSNLTWGMLGLILIITLIMTLFQKYGTDQATIKELKDEQRSLQKEMREIKDDPAKVMELQKKTFPLTMDLMKHSMRPIVYTSIPIILFFRWFMDYFEVLGNPKFFGFFSWFWFYLIASIIFGTILRKILKVQ